MPPPHTVELSFENLAKLGDGDLAAWFALQIRAAVDDCRDRPTHAGARKVTIECLIKPIVEDGKPVRDAAVAFSGKTNLPKVQSRIYQMRLTTNGLSFNPDAGAQIDQMPLPFEESHEEK